MRIAATALAAAAIACTTPAALTSTPAEERAPAALPPWLHAPAGVVPAPELEEAAALLCARDTDAVIDDDARHAARVTDGQVVGLMRKAPTPEAARDALARD